MAIWGLALVPGLLKQCCFRNRSCQIEA